MKFKKLINIVSIYVIIVTLLNLSFWVLVDLKFDIAADLYEDGMIVKIGPLNYAMVFAHGSFVYNCLDNPICHNGTVSSHITTIYDTQIPTFELIDELHQEGYTHIWLSQCHTGDQEYMAAYLNGTRLMWPEYVSRNKRYGITIPVFTGVNFIQLGGEYGKT